MVRSRRLDNSKLTIEVVHGDLTLEDTDAIICSTDNFLQFKGGVAARILSRGGNEIKKETDEILMAKLIIPTGSVEVTSSGNMQCKYVFHAVGPDMNAKSQLGLDKDKLMEYAINNVLDLSYRLGCTSISLPAIATGHRAYSTEKCAEKLFKCVRNFARELGDDNRLHTVRFIDLDKETI